MFTYVDNAVMCFRKSSPTSSLSESVAIPILGCFRNFLIFFVSSIANTPYMYPSEDA